MRLIGVAVILAVSLTLAPLAPEAQHAGTVYRFGYLSPRPGIETQDKALIQALRELGYVEGQNLVIEWRFAKGNIEMFPSLAAEIVRLKVDCILAVGVQATRAAKQATPTIPIVMGGVAADPVQEGLIASFARPGGNVTGVYAFGEHTYPANGSSSLRRLSPTPRAWPLSGLPSVAGLRLFFLGPKWPPANCAYSFSLWRSALPTDWKPRSTARSRSEPRLSSSWGLDS
jgi:putative ABC transport system substrate-binding protein